MYENISRINSSYTASRPGIALRRAIRVTPAAEDRVIEQLLPDDA
jgi:hypothetical protein